MCNWLIGWRNKFYGQHEMIASRIASCSAAGRTSDRDINRLNSDLWIYLGSVRALLSLNANIIKK